MTPGPTRSAESAEANAQMLDAIADSPTAFGFYQVEIGRAHV